MNNIDYESISPIMRFIGKHMLGENGMERGTAAAAVAFSIISRSAESVDPASAAELSSKLIGGIESSLVEEEMERLLEASACIDLPSINVSGFSLKETGELVLAISCESVLSSMDRISRMVKVLKREQEASQS